LDDLGRGSEDYNKTLIDMAIQSQTNGTSSFASLGGANRSQDYLDFMIRAGLKTKFNMTSDFVNGTSDTYKKFMIDLVLLEVTNLTATTLRHLNLYDQTMKDIAVNEQTGGYYKNMSHLINTPVAYELFMLGAYSDAAQEGCKVNMETFNTISDFYASFVGAGCPTLTEDGGCELNSACQCQDNTYGITPYVAC